MSGHFFWVGLEQSESTKMLISCSKAQQRDLYHRIRGARVFLRVRCPYVTLCLLQLSDDVAANSDSRWSCIDGVATNCHDHHLPAHHVAWDIRKLVCSIQDLAPNHDSSFKDIEMGLFASRTISSPFARPPRSTTSFPQVVSILVRHSAKQNQHGKFEMDCGENLMRASLRDLILGVGSWTHLFPDTPKNEALQKVGEPERRNGALSKRAGGRPL